MMDVTSPGFAVLVGSFPFLGFFVWLAFQSMDPRQRDAPKIPTYKPLLALAVLVCLGICMLLFLLVPTAHATPAKMRLAQPRAERGSESRWTRPNEADPAVTRSQ
jgi:hypothetical protein